MSSAFPDFNQSLSFWPYLRHADLRITSTFRTMENPTSIRIGRVLTRVLAIVTLGCASGTLGLRSPLRPIHECPGGL
jgi:hypothetical protein